MSDPGPIRVVVVDDEPPARALLREYLAGHDGFEVVAECANGFEAVKRIAELVPDLVFLDVQMPKLDGFEVLELLDPGPLVIFATAFDEYALRAFEVHAVDYLLKPFGRERLAEALERARERVADARAEQAARAARAASALPAPAAPDEAQDDEPDDPPPARSGPVRPATSAIAARLAADARPSGQWTERLLVKEGSQVHVIPVEKLDFLEAQDDYVAIHAEGKSFLKTQPLADLAAGLDPARFVRVHRSYVLHIERIARLELYAKDSRVAILASGREIPVSRSGYQRLRELM